MNTPPGGGRLRVALVSDVSVGYGTPQLLRMADSFCGAFDAAVQIFEPDEPERPPVDIGDHVQARHVSLERIYTSAHPYWAQGRIEYCFQVAEKVRRLEPHILIFSTMYGIQILERLDGRAMLKIFYCLEDVDLYYKYLFPLVRQCDIMLFPEENRARLYLDRLGGPRPGQDVLLVYNTNDRKEWTEPRERMMRIFYGGSFDKHATLAEYFLRPELAPIPIDIYGAIRGFGDPSAVVQQLHGRDGGIKFCGYRQSDGDFFRLLSRHLYSVVIWNPDREDRFYAAPNKFFDAISCGVPPIAAPHPQCVEIIRKWNCGILLDDWSFDSLRSALLRALRAAGSTYYSELAANCHRAMSEELAWTVQFARLVPIVRRGLARVGTRIAI